MLYLQQLNQNLVNCLIFRRNSAGESFHLCPDEPHGRFFVEGFKGDRLLSDFVLPWALPPITWRPPLACQIQQCPHKSKFGFLWATPAVLREVGISVCVWVKNLAHPIWPNPTVGSIPIQKSATAAGCQYTNFIRSRSSWQFCIEDWGLKTTSSSHKDREANLLSKKEPFWQIFFLSFLNSSLAGYTSYDLLPLR